MNKTELVAAIAAKADITKKDAEKALAAAIEAITKAVKKGDKVQLVGFGTLRLASVPPVRASTPLPALK